METKSEEGSSGGVVQEKPTVIITIGMAGCGKTTFIQRLNAHLHMNDTPGYIINMDPAVMKLPYGTNIDIRDTVNYKEVMKQYNLGPNGGILTSCNLFATRFDQVIKLCEKKRKRPIKYIIVDTPGQIEIFTWSASGQIVTELFASSFPTIIAYVVDTPRCISPQTFMSNMLQACSILYKNRLPLLLVFNKTDVTSHEFAVEWMSDFEAFYAALDEDTSYSATLSRSLCLVLDEFYTNMKHVGISAVMGTGIDQFFDVIEECAKEYESYYKVEYDKMKKERTEKELQRQKEEMGRFQQDAQGAVLGGIRMQQGAKSQAEELMEIAEELEENVRIQQE